MPDRFIVPAHAKYRAAEARFTVECLPGGWHIMENGRAFCFPWATEAEAKEVCGQLRHAFVCGARWEYEEGGHG